jgi:hypothetical protein
MYCGNVKKNIKTMNNIKAYVYAQSCYTENKFGYGIYTLNMQNKRGVSFFPGKVVIEGGLWDGVRQSGVGWADDIYPSLQELVNVIRDGVEQYPHLKSFDFCFDLPDILSVEFFKDITKPEKKFTVEGNLLYRERPLNEHERETFARAFTALTE